MVGHALVDEVIATRRGLLAEHRREQRERERARTRHEPRDPLVPAAIERAAHALQPRDEGRSSRYRWIEGGHENGHPSQVSKRLDRCNNGRCDLWPRDHGVAPCAWRRWPKWPSNRYLRKSLGR